MTKLSLFAHGAHENSSGFNQNYLLYCFLLSVLVEVGVGVGAGEVGVL